MLRYLLYLLTRPIGKKRIYPGTQKSFYQRHAQDIAWIFPLFLKLGAKELWVTVPSVQKRVSALYINAELYEKRLKEEQLPPLSTQETMPLPNRKTTEKAIALICLGNEGLFEKEGSFAALYLDRGIDVFFFNYLGCGKSEGSPNEERSYATVNAVYGYIQKAFPSHIIFGHGMSLGGAMILSLLDVNPHLPLILDRTFCVLSEVVPKRIENKTLARLLSLVTRVVYPYESLSKITNAKGPVLIIRGSDDALMDASYAPRLCAALAKARLLARGIDPEKDAQALQSEYNALLGDFHGGHGGTPEGDWWHYKKDQLRFDAFLEQIGIF